MLMDLLEALYQFKGSFDEKELEKYFSELAPAFLYGGYINLNNEYRVYIKTVEFYFHSETSDGVKDPIVYHRNGKIIKKRLSKQHLDVIVAMLNTLPDSDEDI